VAAAPRRNSGAAQIVKSAFSSDLRNVPMFPARASAPILLKKLDPATPERAADTGPYEEEICQIG
jgi:hypothetical protein